MPFPQIISKIEKSERILFLRKDFKEFGNYAQVSRNLKKLTVLGYLINIGYGIYAKARKSSITGEIIPVASLPTLARIALKRLGVEVTASSLERDYNAGKTLQIPTGLLVGVKKPVKRRMEYNGIKINYELIK